MAGSPRSIAVHPPVPRGALAVEALALAVAAEAGPDVVDVLELLDRRQPSHQVDDAGRSLAVDDAVEDLLAQQRVGIFADEPGELRAAFDVVTVHTGRSAAVQRAGGCEVGVRLILAGGFGVLP